MIKVSKDASYHVKKRLVILKKYPEIRQYQKPYYYSIIWILFLVLIQFKTVIVAFMNNLCFILKNF